MISFFSLSNKYLRVRLLWWRALVPRRCGFESHMRKKKLSCGRREEVAVFSGVGARDVREKQVSRASLQGRSGEGGVEGRGTVWYFKVKEVEVWQFCLYGTHMPNITVLLTIIYCLT